MLDDPRFYSELSWLSSNWRRGVLPGPGGVADQPAKLVELVKLVMAAEAYVDEERVRSMERR